MKKKEHPAITSAFDLFTELTELETGQCVKCGNQIILDEHHIVPKGAYRDGKGKKNQQWFNGHTAKLCKKGTGKCHDEIHEIYYAAQRAAGRRWLSALSYCILFSNYKNGIDSRIGEAKSLNSRPRKPLYKNMPPISKRPLNAFVDGVAR